MRAKFIITFLMLALACLGFAPLVALMLSETVATVMAAVGAVFGAAMIATIVIDVWRWK